MRKPLIMLTAASVIGLAAAAQADDTEIRGGLEDFTEIEIKGGLELSVTQGSRYEVEISAERHLGDVETTVEDGRLVISMEGRKRWNNADIEVNITLPLLTKLVVNGAIDGDLNDIDTESLDIVINGAADLDADGSCGVLELTINGAGDANLRNLECDKVEATINGAGDASVYASDTVNASVNGVGEIDVYGGPKSVSTNKSWFSSINIHNRD